MDKRVLDQRLTGRAECDHRARQTGGDHRWRRHRRRRPRDRAPQGAASVTQLDYNPEPPSERDEGLSLWPSWPLLLCTLPAHAEDGQRRYQVAVQRFVGDDAGKLHSMVLAEVRVHRDSDGRRTIVPVGEEVEIPCELVMFAIGFVGPSPDRCSTTTASNAPAAA